MTMATGMDVTCGITTTSTTNTLMCWGDNSYGHAKPPTTGGPWSDISSGDNHACAWNKAAGRVACWGADEYLGMDLGPDGRTKPPAAYQGKFIGGLSVSGGSSCALVNEIVGELFPGVYDNVVCWGDTEWNE
jgi:hypothetical protein